MCRRCLLGRQQDSRHAGALQVYHAFCGSCASHSSHPTCSTMSCRPSITSERMVNMYLRVQREQKTAGDQVWVLVRWETPVFVVVVGNQVAHECCCCQYEATACGKLP